MFLGEAEPDEEALKAREKGTLCAGAGRRPGPGGGRVTRLGRSQAGKEVGERQTTRALFH